jgi:DmsE family decaheme c-type cytochrome
MCQACHGDASEHLKDPMKAKPANPLAKGKPAAEKAAVCLTCHSGNRNLAFWTSGKHSLNDVACSDCHSIHNKDGLPTINKFVTTSLPNQAEVCWSCHQQIRAANFKPSHHPIIEGKVKCTDCHNPHGALTPSMVKQPRSTTSATRVTRTSAVRTCSTIRRSKRTARPATTRTDRSTASF